MNKDWRAGLARLVASIERAFGRGVLTTAAEIVPAATLSSGMAALDEMLGGGVGAGQLVEVAGAAGSGKTSLALQLAVGAQARGEVVAFVDVERALCGRYAAALGVDLASTLLGRPAHAEAALELVEALVASGDVGLVVVDSVAALVPKAESGAELGVDPGPLQARLLGRALPRVALAAAKSGCVVVLVNQLRERHGTMAANDAPAGGHALGYYAATRLVLRSDGAIEEAGGRAGERVKVEVRKSRVVAPGTCCELELRYGGGFAACAVANSLAEPA